jgi:hypothetical protein
MCVRTYVCIACEAWIWSRCGVAFDRIAVDAVKLLSAPQVANQLAPPLQRGHHDHEHQQVVSMFLRMFCALWYDHTTTRC